MLVLSAMALNSVNPGMIPFTADGNNSVLKMFILMPGGCLGSSSPLVSLLQLFIFMKKSEVPAAFYLKW